MASFADAPPGDIAAGEKVRNVHYFIACRLPVLIQYPTILL